MTNSIKSIFCAVLTALVLSLSFTSLSYASDHKELCYITASTFVNKFGTIPSGQLLAFSRMQIEKERNESSDKTAYYMLRQEMFHNLMFSYLRKRPIYSSNPDGFISSLMLDCELYMMKNE